MEWRIAGAYVTSCSCSGPTHWPVDGTMSDKNGSCSGVAAFWIEEGNHHQTDLGSLAFAVYNFFPPKMTSGDWTVGLVVADRATEDQAAAIERIVSGRAGGPFGSLAGMVGEYLGREEADIRFSGEASPSVWIEGHDSYRFEASRDAAGEPVSAPNAMFTFAQDFLVGRTTGEHYAFGETWTPGYGEYARYAFSDETLGLEQGLGRRP